jgi:serine/threonine protein kinase
MNPDVLCMGCMADTNAADVCPYCAYVNHSPAESPAQLMPRTILNGKYVLGRVLGQGGFGVTYLAYDLEQSRKLAIKEYFPAIISTRGRDRLTVTPLSSRNRQDLDYGLGKFHEEARALFQFKNHANVVHMVDFFHANGTGYIVMVYIEGRTFKEHLLLRGGRIPFTEAMASLGQVMNALHDLHNAGILHRDVSPDNIYLEDGGNVRLLDFGATRYAMGEQSRSLSVVLKPGYAPEEQYRSRGRQGPWTDIYSLGATFYRAISGQVPQESMDRLQHDELVPPSQLGADVSTDSEAAVLKAMAVRAELRFQSIAEFRAAFAPTAVPPASIRKSKSIFLPVIACCMLVALVSAAAPSLFPVFIIAQLVLYASMLVLFRLMWNSIQDGYATTTPARAVLLSLVPVFNLFWIFVVIWGFADAYNKYIDRHLMRAKKLDGKLLLGCSITLAAYWLFWVTLQTTGIGMFLIVHTAFLLPAVTKICDAVDELKLAEPRKAEVHGVVHSPLPKLPVAQSLSLHCASGDYQGQSIEIGDRGIVIGRNPALANLVLSSAEVSGKHVRVWCDSAASKAWIEDLQSTNGTFYLESRSSANVWIRLSGSKLLSVGDRFRLSSSAAEFEVIST